MKKDIASQMFDYKSKKIIQKDVENIEMTSKITRLRNINSRSNCGSMTTKHGLELMIKKTNESINYHNTKSTTTVHTEMISLPTTMK